MLTATARTHQKKLILGIAFLGLPYGAFGMNNERVNPDEQLRKYHSAPRQFVRTSPQNLKVPLSLDVPLEQPVKTPELSKTGVQPPHSSTVSQSISDSASDATNEKPDVTEILISPRKRSGAVWTGEKNSTMLAGSESGSISTSDLINGPQGGQKSHEPNRRITSPFSLPSQNQADSQNQSGDPSTLKTLIPESQAAQEILASPRSRRITSPSRKEIQEIHSPRSKFTALLSPRKKPIKDDIHDKFSTMQAYEKVQCLTSLEFLCLKFYRKRTQSVNKNYHVTSDKSIGDIKPEKLLNKFWNYPVSDILKDSNQLEKFESDTLKLIIASAAFLIEEIDIITSSPGKQVAYKENFFFALIKCYQELSKRFPEEGEYHYHTAKYLTLMESYFGAWDSISKCQELSPYTNNPKEDVKWLEQLKTNNLLYRFKTIDNPAKAQHYLEIAGLTEAINKYKNYKQSINFEVINFYLESIKCYDDLELAFKKIQLWRPDIHLALAYTAYLHAQKEEKSENKLEQISNYCFKLFIEYFERGKTKSNFKLGDIYFSDEEIPEGFQGIFRWYHKVADSSYLTELFIDLGAFKWYQNAADKGNVVAQYNLGWIYEHGRGILQDEKIALTWYKRAADQKDATAQFKVGCMYEKGRGGVKRNSPEAEKYYQMAAAQGHADALVRLSSMYMEKAKSELDYMKVIKNYRNAAIQGHPKAQYKLGWMYAKGHGEPQNYKEAAIWYKKAAENGCKAALVKLGLLYQKGHGVEQNHEKAFLWFIKAAEQGYAKAQFHAGWCYYLGLGVPQDYEKAVASYRKASNQGEANAYAALGFMYEEGLGVQKSYEDAFECYQTAAYKGHILGENNLSVLYDKGLGVEQDDIFVRMWSDVALRNAKANKTHRFTSCMKEKVF